MASKTETALIALVAALTAAASASTFPTPQRNEILTIRPLAFGTVDFAFFNVLDGAGDVVAEMLGADEGVDNGYEIEHRAEVEWLVHGGTAAARESTFDAGLVAIDVAVKADRTLGGAVDHCRIERVTRSHLATDGLDAIKACVVTVLMTFTSNRPF